MLGREVPVGGVLASAPFVPTEFAQKVTAHVYPCGKISSNTSKRYSKLADPHIYLNTWAAKSLLAFLSTGNTMYTLQLEKLC